MNDTTGTLFDNGIYQPEADPTVSTWGRSVDMGEGLKPSDAKIDQVAPGVHAYASVRVGAWHKLGTVIDHPASAEELLKASHGNYDVFLTESWAHHEVIHPDGSRSIQRAKDPRSRATCRHNPVTGALEVLGNVSPTYRPIAAREAFLSFGDALIESAAPTAAVAANVRDGRQQFMCWKLPQGILVNGVDAIDLWLLVALSHDKSMPLMAAVTPNRSVCVNTVRYNLANAISRFSIRHTQGADLALQEARTALELTYAYADELQAEMQRLMDTHMTDRNFETIITRNWAPDPDAHKNAQTRWETKRSQLMQLFRAPTQDAVAGTAYAGLQAVTEMVDWIQPVRSFNGWTDSKAAQLWRSLEGSSPTVEAPKQLMLKAVREFAGI